MLPHHKAHHCIRMFLMHISLIHTDSVSENVTTIFIFSKPDKKILCDITCSLQSILTIYFLFHVNL